MQYYRINRYQILHTYITRGVFLDLFFNPLRWFTHEFRFDSKKSNILFLFKRGCTL